MMNMGFSFPDGFGEYREKLDGEYTPVLIGLSGGSDSVTLFYLTAALCQMNGGYFYACHVNHGIRGEEAIRDRDFCIGLAESCEYCKDIFVLNADIPSMCRESGRSLELEARLCRYDFFEKVMKEHNINLLATAHNADDNLETLIFNLVRGSGIKGMCGIPPFRELSEGRRVIRPLLSTSKSDIVDFCQRNSLPFVTDSTNKNSDYSRNLIRNEVIPLLERINPSLRCSSSRLSESMRQACEYMENEADKILAEGNLTVKTVRETPTAMLPFIFGDALKAAGYDSCLESVHVKSLLALCEEGREGSSISLPGSVSGKIKNGSLTFLSDEKPPAAAEYEIALTEGETPLPDGSRLILLRGDQTEENIYKFATKLYAKFDTISLTVRNRRPGDKITVKGVHKSLKKLMCDEGLQTDLRDRIPVVLQKDIIVAVPGVAVCDSFFSKKKEADYTLIWVL